MKFRPKLFEWPRPMVTYWVEMDQSETYTLAYHDLRFDEWAEEQPFDLDVDAAYDQWRERFQEEQLRDAREYFIRSYGLWFVEMGFAKGIEETAFLVTRVDDEYADHLLQLDFKSERMATYFRLAFSEVLVRR